MTQIIIGPNEGPQTCLLESNVFELFFGGARGGGKTLGLLLDWLKHADRYGNDANGLCVRRELTQLVDMIRESQKLYTQLGWTWRESEKTWITKTGARLRFDHLENDQDASRYQGWSLTWLGVEEIGLFPRPEPIMLLKACLRSPNPDVKLAFRATGNPGGPGMGWVKKRYIDPAPKGYALLTDPSGLERMFIPSRIKDNPYLDKGYEARVRSAAPNEAIARAWVEGDWNISEGAFFTEFEFNKHVIPATRVPNPWQPRTMSYDLGGASPSAAVWSVVVPDNYETEVRGQYIFLPKNSILVYREKYWSKDHNNEGLNLPIEQEAADILRIERDEPEPERIRRFADPSIFNRMKFTVDGASYRDRFAAHGVYFARAANTRVDGSHIMGWNLLRHYLLGQDGHPMLHIMDNCVDLIRTLAALERDPVKPDDARTDGEDHLPDALRYNVSTKPFSSPSFSQQIPYSAYAEGTDNRMVVTPPPLEDYPSPRLSLTKRRIQ